MKIVDKKNKTKDNKVKDNAKVKDNIKVNDSITNKKASIISKIDKEQLKKDEVKKTPEKQELPKDSEIKEELGAFTKVKIEKLDHQGRGICYIDSKITFIDNALPGELVNIKLLKETKKYNEGIVTKYLKTSSKRVESPCPYFNTCGGCELLHSKYEDTIKFKKEKLTSILKKYANITYDLDIITTPHHLSYRNKITLKVLNSQYGYYKVSTHNLVKIDNCLLAEPAIAKFLPDISYLDIRNGEIVIRTNYNGELLINIKTKEKIKPNIEYLKDKHKIVGIILNDKILVGEPSFVERIALRFFNVSYDSFFQINRHICSIIFDLVKKYTQDSQVILDLYCGVGTLGLSASQRTNKKVYGIEIVPNAVVNAVKNASINKVEANYLLGPVEECLPKIKEEVDTIIVDPPRAGLDNTTKETIITKSPRKIIYISCDPLTLARDLKELLVHYDIITIKGLDMFPFTYHIETFCVLKKKEL